MRARDIPAEDRLLAKLVPQADGCWHWTGFIDPQGYGRMGFKGRKSALVHHVAHEILVGPVPDGLTLDHTCHTFHPDCVGGTGCLHRRCANPDHLEPVTLAENNARGKARITHCPHGHEYTAENTYRKMGRRFCRTCSLAQGRAYKARKRAKRAV